MHVRQEPRRSLHFPLYQEEKIFAYIIYLINFIGTIKEKNIEYFRVKDIS